MTEKLLALDTETTGLDLHHDARPFAVTTCDEEGNQLFYEWEVDPWKRTVIIPPEDVIGIRELIESVIADGGRLVFHNAKFDITAFERIGVYPPGEFPWESVEDTIIAHHCLYSAKRHSLDKCVLQSFGEDIEHLEKNLEKAVQEARRLCRSKSFQELQGTWKIAKPGIPGHPSLGASSGDKKDTSKKSWKADTWLPLTVAREMEYPPNHPWWSVLELYANADSKWTIDLWLDLKDRLERRGLEKIYRARTETLPVAADMERQSLTGSLDNADELFFKYGRERKKRIFDCREIARGYGYNLDMPKSGNNECLTTFVFDHLNLPVVKKTKTGGRSLDKDVFDIYEKELPEGDGREFIEVLMKKRRLDTSLQYLDGYKRYWKPSGEGDANCHNHFSDISNHSNISERRDIPVPDRMGTRVPSRRSRHFRLHPNLNPTGTVQLRWSSSNPNSQNISKLEGYNLRYIFGPEPGWEWWSLDYQNVELRIPTFKAKEQKLMDVFLRPREAPYFGSYHLVVFDALYPELFAKHGAAVKELFESTLYQWVKNGNFAMIYGAGRRKVDVTYHFDGAYDLVRDRFPAIARLADEQIALARKYGYVETVPDASVDPTRGFPIMAGRTEAGSVLPTTPLNYFVSGTAMWLTGRSMVRCHRQLREWGRDRIDPITGRIVMQIHDELVFAFPKSEVDPKWDLENEKAHRQLLTLSNGEIDLGAYGSNLGRVRVLQRLMERGGDDIGVPTPCGVEYNADNWAEVTLKC